jgi:hypothetical protein
MLRLRILELRGAQLGGVRNTFAQRFDLPPVPPATFWPLLRRLDEVLRRSLPRKVRLTFVAHDERGLYEAQDLSALYSAVVQRDHPPRSVQIVISSGARKTAHGRLSVDTFRRSQSLLADIDEIRLLGLIERVKSLFDAASQQDAVDLWSGIAASPRQRLLGRASRSLWKLGYPWVVAIGGGVVATALALWLKIG